jgi:glycosyltransferase involved in cell wall biosynthesis
MNNKPKVLFIERIFPAYRRFVYDKLAERFNFLMLHGDKDPSVKLAKTDYSRILKVYNYRPKDTHFVFNTITPLFSFKPKAIIHESSIGILSLLPTWFFSKIMGAKFILYGHGYNRFTGFDPKQNWADKYRVFLMKISDATIVYTHTDKKRMAQFVSSDKIFVAQNTLDTRPAHALRTQFDDVGKTAIKEKLGFTRPFNLIYIGRIVEEKRPEVLLNVFEQLNKILPDQIGIHFVGGGEVEPLQQRVADNGWQNAVKFHGWVHDAEQSGALLYASDLMIMPGNVGLAVNHAFMFDCPVVTFLQTEMSPPEIEYIVDGETGFKIPDFSSQKMAAVIQDYLQNPVLQQNIYAAIRHKMDKELTPENMLKGFVDAVEYVLGHHQKDSIGIDFGHADTLKPT